MKFLKDNWLIGILIGVVVAIFLIYPLNCNKDNTVDNSKQLTIDSLILANQKLVQDTNRLGQLLVKQEVINIQNQAALKAYALENLALKAKDEKRIKEITSVVKENTELKIKNKFIPFTKDSLIFIDTTKPCPSNAILLPKTLIDTLDKDFQFYATLEKQGLRIDSLSIPDTQNIVIAVTKGGLLKKDVNGKLKFWKKRTTEVFVTHTNKYLKVTGLNSLIYKPKPKARWLEKALIIGGTILIYNQITK